LTDESTETVYGNVYLISPNKNPAQIVTVYGSKLIVFEAGTIEGFGVIHTSSFGQREAPYHAYSIHGYLYLIWGGGSTKAFTSDPFVTKNLPTGLSDLRIVGVDSDTITEL
jgi:hypothetical protein